MSSTPFGDHLKREREMRGVTIEEISAATRISTRFLEALESEQWERLPGGVFNRGFIRSIARFLGLDEESLVAEYELVTRENAALQAAVSQPSQIPRSWRVATALIAALAIVAGTGWWGYRHYRLKVGARAHRQPISVPSAASPSLTAVEPSANRAAPSPSGGATAAASASDDRPASAAAAEAEGALTLKMQAGKAAEVKVIADDKTAFDGHVGATEVMYFSARDSFEITSSEAGALLLELNGQALPPMGAAGQPGSIRLTRKDLQSFSGGTH